MADHSKMSMSWWAAAVVVVFAFVVLSPQRASAVAVRGRMRKDEPPKAEEIKQKKWKCGNWTAEFLLIYDLTSSYADDVVQLNLTAPVLFDKMREQFPGAKFALATFRDKPVFMKEVAPDHCFVTQHPMVHDTTDMLKVIEQLKTAPGIATDTPEAQRDALYHGLMSETVGWTTNKSDEYGTQILRVVIMATDAIPHPAGDAKHLSFKYNTGHFIPHNGTFEPMCDVLDYPDDKLIKRAFKQRDALPLFFVVGTYQHDPYRKLINAIGQGGSVQTLAEDSSNLAKLVAKGLRDITCDQLPPPTPRPGSPAEKAAKEKPAEETPAEETPAEEEAGPKVNKKAAILAAIIAAAILACCCCLAACGLAYAKLSNRPPAELEVQEETEPAEVMQDKDRQAGVQEEAFA